MATQACSVLLKHQHKQAIHSDAAAGTFQPDAASCTVPTIVTLTLLPVYQSQSMSTSPSILCYECGKT